MFNAIQLIWSNDNYDLQNSHFAGSNKKVVFSKNSEQEIIFWGAGNAKR